MRSATILALGKLTNVLHHKLLLLEAERELKYIKGLIPEEDIAQFNDISQELQQLHESISGLIETLTAKELREWRNKISWATQR